MDAAHSKLTGGSRLRARRRSGGRRRASARLFHRYPDGPRTDHVQGCIGLARHRARSSASGCVRTVVGKAGAGCQAGFERDGGIFPVAPRPITTSSVADVAERRNGNTLRASCCYFFCGRRAYTAAPSPNKPRASNRIAPNQFCVRTATIVPAKSVLTKTMLVVEMGERLLVCEVKHFLNGGIKVSARRTARTRDGS